MATDNKLENSWRFIFGDSNSWAPPKLDNPLKPASAHGAETWHVIFGSTAAWLPPQLDHSENGSQELCELCRQPVNEAEGFVTNSAGQRPTHAHCLGIQPELSPEGKPPRRPWLRALYGFAKPMRT
jgi:hypothetical protein